MKKLFALMLVLTCMCTAFAAVHAETEPLFYVEAPAQAGIGDTVSVRIGVTGDFTASILNLKFYYDKDSFEYIEHTRGPVLDSVVMSGMSVCEHSEEKHMIAAGILITGDEGFSTQGVIFEATFKVLSSAKKNAELTLDVSEFDYLPISATVSTPINHKIENASVEISGGGSGSGVVVTAQPIHTPTVPQQTRPAATQGADSTAPAATEGADNTPAADPQGGSAEGTEPVSDGTEPAGETAAPADSKNNGESDTEHTEPAAEPSGLAKALMIAGGCVLAAGLAWLTVFFFKRGRAAGKEAKNNNGGKAQ